MEPHQAVRRSLGVFLVWLVLINAHNNSLTSDRGFNLVGDPYFNNNVYSHERVCIPKDGVKIIKKVNANALSPGSYPQFENLVEGLCVAHGFRHPNLFVISDSAPNMMMVGRNSSLGNLITTTGLLEKVNRVELEGLITHELSRTRNRLALLDSTTAVFVARPLFLMPSLSRWLTNKIFAPWAVAETDLQAVRLTRYPTALASALGSLNVDGREPKSNPKFCRHLWINPPPNPLVISGFNTNDRIAALSEL